MATAAEWVETLIAYTRSYSQTRKASPIVQVTLDPTGEEFFLFGAEPAGAELVALSAYGPGREKEIVTEPATPEKPLTESYTHRLVLVHPTRIAKVDLLYRAPNALPFGFVPPGTDASAVGAPASDS